MTFIPQSGTARRLQPGNAMKPLIQWGLVCLMLWSCSAGGALDEVALLEEYRPVLDLGSFGGAEAGALPEGWEFFEGDAWPENSQPVSSGTWSLAEGSVPGGGVAVCITAAKTVFLVSPQIHLNNDLRSLSGSITAAGEEDAAAMLYWMAGEKVLETVAIHAASGTEGRRRFNLSEAERPVEAESMRVVLVVYGKSGAPFRWQTVRFMGLYAYVPQVALMYNRVGYEQVAPKYFTASSNFPARSARFSITNTFGEVVYEASLGEGCQIKGAEGVTWEDFYYQGDFTGLEEEGDYTLTIKLDDYPEVTGPVRIRFNLLWEEAFLPAVVPFQKCRAVSGSSADVLRLWEDPGLNTASDAGLLWSLAQAWSLLQGRFPGDPRLLFLEEEALYGAGALAEWLLRGNAEQIARHDEFPLYLNALTCIAHYKQDADNLKEAARLLMKPLLDEKRRGMWFFFAAMDLYDATGEVSYLEYAKEIYPDIVLDRAESLLDYEYATDTPVSVFLREAFSRQADALLANAANPFGLVRSQEYAGKGFFTWNAGVNYPLLGNSVRLLSAVQMACQAYRYSAQKEYLTFVYNQLNWLLGNNPFGVCLISGLCGEHNPPVFHSNAPEADSEGALVLHGTGPREPDLDLPCFSVSSEGAPGEYTNGFSLHNNARYIKAMAYLKRIPVVRPR